MVLKGLCIVHFSSRKQNWVEAIHWYDTMLNMMDYDEGGEYDGTQDEPRYLLLAREAEMYQEGGFDLKADPQRSGQTPSWLNRSFLGLNTKQVVVSATVTILRFRNDCGVRAPPCGSLK